MAGIGTVAVAAAVAGLWLWFAVAPSQRLELRVAEVGPDPATQGVADVVDLQGTFETFDGQAGTTVDAWPRFRGASSDNMARTGVELATEWTSDGPPRLWSVALGDGYAGPAVRNGRVYVLDYDVAAKGDALRCFSITDGREIWRRSYEVRVKRNHGMSRTVPAVTDAYVVSLGPKCHVLCVDAVTGDFRWGIDLVHDYGSEVPLWYASQCPLIDQGMAVLAPGGEDVLMMGVDCASGEVAWQTPNPDGWSMSHASIIPATVHGKRQYVYCAIGGVVGVSAEPADRGTVLWKTPDWDFAVVAPSAVVMPDGKLLVTAGYGAGSRLFQLEKTAAGWSAEVLHTWGRKHFACEQQTPLLYNGTLITVMPNDGGALNRQLVCMRPDGTHVWSSGKTTRFGLGPFMIVNDRLLVMRDDGTLTMAAADGAAYRELASASVLHGREAWAPMAFVDGLLVCRDAEEMVCLDLRVGGRATTESTESTEGN